MGKEFINSDRTLPFRMADLGPPITVRQGEINAIADPALRPSDEFIKGPPRCIQEATGSCQGCNMLDMVLERTQGLPKQQQSSVVERINKSLCPEGNQIIIPPEERGKYFL